MRHLIVRTHDEQENLACMYILRMNCALLLFLQRMALLFFFFFFFLVFVRLRKMH